MTGVTDPNGAAREAVARAQRADRARPVRVVAFAVAALALIVAGVAFAYAAVQAREARQAIAAEVIAHCRADAADANRQRALDLALLAADRAVIARLTATLAHGTDEDRDEAAAALSYYRAAAAARVADLPAYEDPADCLTAQPGRP
jgi:hypothetical protein